MQIATCKNTSHFNLTKKELYLIEHQTEEKTRDNKELHYYNVTFDFQPYRHMWLYVGDVIYFDSSCSIENLKIDDDVLIINKKTGNVQARRIVSKNGKFYFGYKFEYDYLGDNFITVKTVRYELLGKFYSQNINRRKP